MLSPASVEILVERLRAVLPPERLSARRMFGGVALMLDGNMLCCASKSGVMFRVGKDAEPAALARPFAQPCLGTGRPMPGFITVGAEGLDADAALTDWVKLARAYVETLPAKASAAKAKRLGPRRPGAPSQP
jgi:TfoX/Sxy family transcriptional regulator of competence genes